MDEQKNYNSDCNWTVFVPHHNMATIFGRIWMQINKFITHRIIPSFFHSVLFSNIYAFHMHISFPCSSLHHVKILLKLLADVIRIEKKKVHENFIQSLVRWRTWRDDSKDGTWFLTVLRVLNSTRFRIWINQSNCYTK